MKPLISVILPVYNGESFIKDAIHSVLEQSYKNIELIIINDGSLDDTSKIIKGIKDPRILFLEQDNKGVSSARNRGIELMKGEYFCFIDADDKLSPNSIEIRVNKFLNNHKLAFVDGRVDFYSPEFNNLIKSQTPIYKGEPFNKLIKLSSDVFIGITWMVKVEKGVEYRFKKNLTHGEDLLFYISISKDRMYDYVDGTTYMYRDNSESAMSNIDGLGKGYIDIYKELEIEYELKSTELLFLKKKITSIMVKTYIKRLEFFKAIKYYYKIQNI